MPMQKATRIAGCYASSTSDISIFVTKQFFGVLHRRIESFVGPTRMQNLSISVSFGRFFTRTNSDCLVNRIAISADKLENSSKCRLAIKRVGPSHDPFFGLNPKSQIWEGNFW